VLITAEQTRHFITNGLVMSMFRNVYMEIQAGMEFAQEFGLCVLRERSLMTNVITFGSFENFAMKVAGVSIRLMFLSRLLEEQTRSLEGSFLMMPSAF
jgi:hypothetical protein